MSAIPLVLTCFSHICTALETRTGPGDVPLTATPTPSSYSDGASVTRPHLPHTPSCAAWETVAAPGAGGTSVACLMSAMRPAPSLLLPHPRHSPGTWCTVGDGLRPCETPLCPGLRPGLLQSAGSFLGAAFFRLSGMGLADGGLCGLS